MTQVMKGVRILEVAQHTFVPAAGAVLADWGADVIKVEHSVRGDAQRGILMLQRLAVNSMRNMIMQHPNRGKRSIGIDLATEEGQQIIYEIAAQSDVFLTNYLPSARRKLNIDVEDIRKANPKIIYARGSAHGDLGPDRDKGGFDSTAFWARAGSSMLVTPSELGGPLLQPGPAYGDTIGGMNIAGGIAAALFHRERTGHAAELDVSLLSSGIWATACSINISVELNTVPFANMMPGAEAAGSNPFIGVFKTSDGKHLNLTILTPGPYIRDTFEHLNLAHLADDPRYATDVALMENAMEARRFVVEAIGKQTLQYWIDRLKTLKGQWAPYQNVLEVAHDEQVLANNFIFEVESGDGGAPMKLVANPVQFDHTPVQTTRAPEAWEHTELILADMGVDWDRIEELKTKGVIA